MKRLLMAFIRGDKGQDLVEYVILVALLAVSAGAFLSGTSQAIAKIGARMSAVLDNPKIDQKTLHNVQPNPGTTLVVQVVCGVLTAVLLAVIVRRRKQARRGDEGGPIPPYFVNRIDAQGAISRRVIPSEIADDLKLKLTEDGLVDPATGVLLSAEEVIKLIIRKGSKTFPPLSRLSAAEIEEWERD